MVELEKWRFLTAKYSYNLGIYQILKILTILYNANIVTRDQNRNVFYVNNYIDWDKFNQLYTPDRIKKQKENAKITV